MSKTPDINKHFLVRFSKKTGKIDTTIEGLGTALLKLWALNNTTPTKECLILNCYGQVLFHTVGKKNDFPDVLEPENEHINEYCEGLLEVLAWMQ